MKCTPLLASLLLACGPAAPPCDADIAVWEDNDGDGFGGKPLDKVCKGQIEKGTVEVAQDCDDADEQLNPAAIETCDGIDNDCDGQVDDDTNIKQWWFDGDSDSFGGLYRSTLSCSKPGDEWVGNSADCDDTTAAISPDAQEVCGRVDEDCDGFIDESDDSVDTATFSTFYADEDGDGFGDRDSTINRCRLIPGYVMEGDDCDDSNPNVTQAEYHVDADLDGYGDPTQIQMGCANPPPGTVDNDLDCDDTDPALLYESDWFEDPDGDGYGSGPSVAFDCVPPDPYVVIDGGDCNELDPLENPGSPEDCADGIDNNCDFLADDDDPTCLPPCADEELVTSASGSTVGAGDDLHPTCGGSNAEEVAFAFTALTTGFQVFSAQGSGYDTVLAVFDGCGGVQLICNDDWYGLQSRAEVYLTAGQTVIVSMDGYSSSEGNYVLNAL